MKGRDKRRESEKGGRVGRAHLVLVVDVSQEEVLSGFLELEVGVLDSLRVGDGCQWGW